MARPLPVPLPSSADKRRFFAKVSKRRNGCWVWVGARFANGYGMFSLEGKARRAHRVLYVWERGEPNEGLDHICENRACVNPDHLRPLSTRENVLRGKGPTAENARKSGPACGHSEEFSYVDPRGWRGCKICRREAVRRYRERQRRS